MIIMCDETQLKKTHFISLLSQTSRKRKSIDMKVIDKGKLSKIGIKLFENKQKIINKISQIRSYWFYNNSFDFFYFKVIKTDCDNR